VDVSPVPILEFISANLTLPSCIAYSRKYALTLSELIKSLGYGYKVLGNLSKHIGMLNAKIRAITLMYHLPTQEEEVPVFLRKGNPDISAGVPVEIVKELLNVSIDNIEKDVKKAESFRLADFISKHADEMAAGIWKYQRKQFLLGNSPIPLMEPLNPNLTGPAWNSYYYSHWLAAQKVPDNITVSADKFDEIEGLVRSWRLLFTRILSMLHGETLEQNRTLSRKVLSELRSLRYEKQIGRGYLELVLQMKDLMDVPQLHLDLKRVDAPIRLGFDPVHIKLWKFFSSIISKFVKTRSGKPDKK